MNLALQVHNLELERRGSSSMHRSVADRKQTLDAKAVNPIERFSVAHHGLTQIIDHLHLDVNDGPKIRLNLVSEHCAKRLDDLLYFLGRGAIFLESDKRALDNFRADSQNLHTGIVNRRIYHAIDKAEPLVKKYRSKLCTLGGVAHNREVKGSIQIMLDLLSHDQLLQI